MTDIAPRRGHRGEDLGDQGQRTGRAGEGRPRGGGGEVGDDRPLGTENVGQEHERADDLSKRLLIFLSLKLFQQVRQYKEGFF